VALLGYLLTPRLDGWEAAGAVGGVAVIIGMSVYLAARTHSNFLSVGRAYRWTLWIAPVGWFVASASILRLSAEESVTLVGAGISTIVLAAVLIAQHRELRLAAGSRRGAEFVVSLAIYVSAFALFGALYSLASPGAWVPVVVGVMGALLASVPLRRPAAEDSRTAIYCATIGLVLGQTAWALGYWSAATIVVAAFLLLLLYVLAGLAEAILDRSIGRRIVLEFGLVGACGLAIILGVGPWQV
jgi:hypothetical protein